MDLEIRDDLHHHLPPSEMYKTIKREVLITGVSTYRTFDQHITLLHQTLDAGKRVYVLILNPDVNECPDVLALSAREKKDIRAEILQTITIIKEEKLNQHPGFQIKFMQKMPPFTAIMIDGDASHAGRALDEEGRILVQPGTVYETQHEGIILLFKRISRSTMSPFDYFARDLRKQWQNAKEKSDLIQ